MIKSRGQAFTQDLEAKILTRQESFTVVLQDGEEITGVLLDIGPHHLYIKGEMGDLLIPKQGVKYYRLQKKEHREKEEDSPSTLKIVEINIPTAFQKTKPHPKKVKEKKDYYEKHGFFDKPVTVKMTQQGWLLTDGYSRYIAAEELGLTEVEVEKEETHYLYTGTIQNIVKEQGFGFIHSTEQEENIFFHRSNLVGGAFGELEIGDIVEFTIEQGAKGPQAILVRLL